MKNEFGFVKVGVGVPELKIGNVEFNIERIIDLVKDADKNNAKILVLPELSLCGYTCGDLFLHDLLIEKCLKGIENLRIESFNYDVLFFVGMPLELNGRLYNCAVGIHRGKIVGVVPKMYLPNYKEFYEKRWFVSGRDTIKNINTITVNDMTVPFGNIIFSNQVFGYKVGVEICEDLWVTVPPSSLLALNGANIILNLSASNEGVAKSDYRKNMVAMQSAKSVCAYLYSSSGVGESTSDIVFGGDGIIAENGTILKTNERFKVESSIIYTDIDVQRLEYDRKLNKSFADNGEDYFQNYTNVVIPHVNNKSNIDIERTFGKNPFVPDNPTTKNERCKEIFDIQTSALAKRLLQSGVKKAVIGISGGLDSTLAVLVVHKTFEKLGIPFENIIGVTMPGFGTTDRTYNNALDLMKALGMTIREINIKDACLQHFKDIGHDASIHDITYENVQARERTQILMDIANKEGGLVIGTGDLSELVLGWCTYNGDHMSMYSVNCSIPKTLVKFLVGFVAENEFTGKASEVLKDILYTPISPELLPPDKDGKIAQKTEDKIGPYELHDFFIYYFLRWGMSPEKIFFLAKHTFKGVYSVEDIKKWLEVFIRRFFSQQFKRNCVPDGPKVGSVSTSPRGDLRIPSDADMTMWLKDLED